MMNELIARHAVPVFPEATARSAIRTVLARPGPKPLTSWYSAASWPAAPTTVTVNVVDTGLLASSESVAVQVTVVVPTANVLPDGGVHTAAGGVPVGAV